MHCKAVSSFGREIIGKSRSNLARAQLPGVGETRIAMIRTIEKPGRQRSAIYRSAPAHRSRRGRQITIPRGAVENSEQIGKASCRERGGPYVSISVVAASLKNKKPIAPTL